jgi:single-stranded-DNA-specific exonuclease
MAAGLSIHKSNIDEFRRKICAHAEEVLEEEALVPRYFYDGKLHHEQISPNLLNEIDMLAPFGIGNPAPSFTSFCGSGKQQADWKRVQPY